LKEDTAAALKTEREQREGMQSRLDALQQEIQQKTAAPVDHNAFNRDTYYKLVGEDPLMAQNYLDAFRFGISDPSQVPSYFQEMSRNGYESPTANAGGNLREHASRFPAQ